MADLSWAVTLIDTACIPIEVIDNAEGDTEGSVPQVLKEQGLTPAINTVGVGPLYVIMNPMCASDTENGWQFIFPTCALNCSRGVDVLKNSASL